MNATIGPKRRVPGTVPGTCCSRTRHVPGTRLGRRSHVPGTVPPVNGGRNQSRYGRHERRADHGCPETRPSLSPLRALSRAASRCRSSSSPRPRTTSSSPAATPPRRCSTTSCCTRSSRSRSPRDTASRSAASTSSSPPRSRRSCRHPPGCSARCRRLRGRQDPERRRDVGRGLSRPTGSRASSFGRGSRS